MKIGCELQRARVCLDNRGLTVDLGDESTCGSIMHWGLCQNQWHSKHFLLRRNKFKYIPTNSVSKVWHHLLTRVSSQICRYSSTKKCRQVQESLNWTIQGAQTIGPFYFPYSKNLIDKKKQKGLFERIKGRCVCKCLYKIISHPTSLTVHQVLF